MGIPLLLFLVCCFSEAFVFGVLEEPKDHYERKIGVKLRGKGVVSYWDFDEPAVTERVWLGKVLTEGTRRVPGHHGKARAFLPGENGYVSTSAALSLLGTNFTITCLLKLPDPSREQRIFRYMRVEDGRLAFEAPGDGDVLTAEPAADRFFHVAGVVDAGKGEARLYIDGKLRATTPLRRIRMRHEFVVLGQVPGSNPPDFVLDDLAFWNRNLSEDEIAKLVEARAGLLQRLVRSPRHKFNVLKALRRGAHNVVMSADMFNPLYHESAAMSADIQHWNLVLSRADRKAFTFFERRRVLHGINGYCTSDRRTVDVGIDGRSWRSRMELFCPGTGRTGAGKAFTVDLGHDARGKRLRKFVFESAEQHPFMPELLAAKLSRDAGTSVTSPQLCSVTLNGTFDGVYLVRAVGDGLDYYSPSRQRDWGDHLRALPFSNEEILEEYDNMVSDVLPVLLADRTGALNSLEWRHLVKLQRLALIEALAPRKSGADMGTLEMVRDYVKARVLVGRNPAPDYVVEDLDLSRGSVHGVSVSYRSLTPELVSDDGRVSRPKETAAETRVEVTFSQGGRKVSNVLSFTVIPEQTKVPLLRVDFRRRISADSRVPCILQVLENGGHKASECLPGRIRLRGNTSLVRAEKKYFNIRLDRPARLLGIRETRFLMLTSGWRDPTMMRDKMSYDLFKAFGSADSPRFAPTCRLVELVIDGHYRGVYALSDRVDEGMLGLDSDSGDVLYKAGKGYSRGKPYVQKFPDKMAGECWEPYWEFRAAAEDGTPAEFAAKVGQVVDIGNVIDYEILVNITANAEGSRHWTYIARGGRGGDMFYFVPWDFDMTFRHGRWNMNPMTRRLRAELPGYRDRLERRYAELRRGVLSEAAVMSRVNSIEVEIADAMLRNMKCWDLPERKEFHSMVDEMRAAIKERLALMDRKLGGDSR